MKQYCRYCAHAIESCDFADIVWCDKYRKEMSHAQTKRMNRCKEFKFNEIDVFNLENRYKPREKKIKIKIEQLELF